MDFKIAIGIKNALNFCQLSTKALKYDPQTPLNSKGELIFHQIRLFLVRKEKISLTLKMYFILRDIFVKKELMLAKHTFSST